MSFNCDFCENKYKSKQSYKNHLMIKHKEQVIASRENLKNKKVTCQFCQKKFSRKSNLSYNVENSCKMMHLKKTILKDELTEIKNEIVKLKNKPIAKQINQDELTEIKNQLAELKNKSAGNTNNINLKENNIEDFDDKIMTFDNKEYYVDNFNVYAKSTDNKRGELIGIFLNNELIKPKNTCNIDIKKFVECKICDSFFKPKEIEV